MLLNKHRFALLVALATVSLPLAAAGAAQEPARGRAGHPQALRAAPDPLRGRRRRRHRRSTRISITRCLVNVRLAFHITDWLAIAGFGNFGVAKVATGFQDKLIDSLTGSARARRAARADAPTRRRASLQQISSVMGGQLEFTPFTGKYSLFGKLFSAYDFYGFVGPAASRSRRPAASRGPAITPPPLNETIRSPRTGVVTTASQRHEVRADVRRRPAHVLRAGRRA